MDAEAKDMKLQPVDYRKFRFNKLNTPEFRHLKWILFWPVFGGLFAFLELGFQPANWHVIRCAADDLIPFCEWFVLPYILWFPFLIFTLLFLLLFDPDQFRQNMQFITITFFTAVLIYFIYPNCQHLRVPSFLRDNFCTRIVKFYYEFDSDTNVFPSLHVVGALAMMIAALNSKYFRAPGWRIFYIVTAVLISVSTVFIKQHSFVDLSGAVILTVIGYLIVYRRKAK